MTTLVVKLRSVFNTKFNGIGSLLVQYRQGSYNNSPFLVDLGDVKTKYEVTQSPEDWKYVERILPQTIVPTPVPKAKYSSEWKPQGEDVQNLPYYIPRTKNHMIPVYLHTTQRGIRRTTMVRKVEGDIWALEKELRKFLQQDQVRPIRSQVNEFARYIRIHGDHVNAVKYWFMQNNL